MIKSTAKSSWYNSCWIVTIFLMIEMNTLMIQSMYSTVRYNGNNKSITFVNAMLMSNYPKGKIVVKQLTDSYVQFTGNDNNMKSNYVIDEGTKRLQNQKTLHLDDKNNDLSTHTHSSIYNNICNVNTITTRNKKRQQNNNPFQSILVSTIIIFSSSCLFYNNPSYSLTINIPNVPEQKVYSANARNMERLSNGDSSGGSLYNNSPSSDVAAKRRAMIGCKVYSSRMEASRILNNNMMMSEKDCNVKVLGGDSEFMLKALRNLDCPSCPYGIEGA